MKKEEEETHTINSILVLKELDLEIKRGEFVCIVGDVGSGKSSLLSAAIGDLLLLEDKEKGRYSNDKPLEKDEQKRVIEYFKNQTIVKNPIQIASSLSYVQQNPWIENKTIRDNIVFGSVYDEEKYKNTIKICELTRDLEILPNGDMTEIGEKGINLSGGQKARVSLARAVYQEKEIILMDDPISALDANVKKKIFLNVFMKHCKNKTRVLVTHAVDFLGLVDRVIVMREGRIVVQGPYSEIKDNRYLQDIITILAKGE